MVSLYVFQKGGQNNCCLTQAQFVSIKQNAPDGNFSLFWGRLPTVSVSGSTVSPIWVLIHHVLRGNEALKY